MDVYTHFSVVSEERIKANWESLPFFVLVKLYGLVGLDAWCGVYTELRGRHTQFASRILRISNTILENTSCSHISGLTR